MSGPLTNPRRDTDRLMSMSEELAQIRQLDPAPTPASKLTVVVPEALIRANAQRRQAPRSEEAEPTPAPTKDELNAEQIAAMTDFRLRLDRPWQKRSTR